MVEVRYRTAKSLDDNNQTKQPKIMTNEEKTPDRIKKANEYIIRMHEQRVARNIAQLQAIRLELRNISEDRSPDPDEEALIKIQKAELAYFEERLAEDLTGTKLEQALEISRANK